VIVILDGRLKMSTSMGDYLKSIALLDETLLVEAHHGGKPVVMHMFERTLELPSHATQREYRLPLPCSLALKEKNGGKLNSHLWTFMAFAQCVARRRGVGVRRRVEGSDRPACARALAHTVFSIRFCSRPIICAAARLTPSSACHGGCGRACPPIGSGSWRA
jgi:hypothetical protein